MVNVHLLRRCGESACSCIYKLIAIVVNLFGKIIINFDISAFRSVFRNYACARANQMKIIL